MFKHTSTYDKWRHLVSGVPMSLVLYFANHYLFGGSMAIWLSIVLVILISVGFELLSLILKKGTCYMLDALFSVIGGLAGVLLAWVLWPYI